MGSYTAKHELGEKKRRGKKAWTWLQLSLTICGLLEVDVGVAQGSAGDHIPADPNGQHGPGRAELLIEHGLGDIGVQVPHVQRGHGVTAGGRVHLPLGALNHCGFAIGGLKSSFL